MLRLDRGPAALGALAVLAACALLPGTAVAQEVRGRVLVEGSEEPLDGATVTLSDFDGTPVTRALTDAFGRFRLRPRRPGRFRLRVDRIGHTTALSEWFDLGPGETLERDVEARVRPITLEGLDVEGDRRCRIRPEEGVGAARIWEEVRKALVATELTRETRAYRFDVERVVRDLDLEGAVLDETKNRRVVESSAPFGVPPADSLVDGGFVTDSAGTRIYFAPDATILLSDAFLDSHCFRLPEGRSRGGRTGLAFDPLPGRDVPDVSGTLWVESDGGELRLLEYRYENLPWDLEDDRIGGDVHFTRLPDGSWIVRSWRIRMPTLGRRRRSRRLRLVGFREEGAQVRWVLDSRGTVLLDAESATVWGLVVDSVGATPVAGATVSLEGTPRIAETGADGAFLFTGLDPGEYRVQARHESLLAVGHPGVTVSVDAALGEARGVRVRLPSRGRALAERCSDDGPAGGFAVAGVVSDAAGRPLPDIAVTLSWWDPGGVEKKEPGPSVRTDTLGRFILCGVRGEGLLEVGANGGDGAVGAVYVQRSAGSRPVFVRVRLQAPAP